MRTIEDYGYKILDDDNGNPYRRRIDVGEGFELIKSDEVPGSCDSTEDGVTWQRFYNGSHTVKTLLGYHPTIMAFRRKKVEPAITKVYPIWVKVGERLPEDDDYKQTITDSFVGDARYCADKCWRADNGLVIPPNYWLDIGPIPPLPVEESQEEGDDRILNDLILEYAIEKGNLEYHFRIGFRAALHYERTRLKEGEV